MEIATYVQARRRRRQIGDGLMGMITEPYLKVLRNSVGNSRTRQTICLRELQRLVDHKPARLTAVDSFICKVLAS